MGLASVSIKSETIEPIKINYSGLVQQHQWLKFVGRLLDIKQAPGLIYTRERQAVQATDSPATNKAYETTQSILIIWVSHSPL